MTDEEQCRILQTLSENIKRIWTLEQIQLEMSGLMASMAKEIGELKNVL